MFYVLEWSSSHRAGSNLLCFNVLYELVEVLSYTDKDEEHFVFAVWLVKLLIQVKFIKVLSDQTLQMFT